MALGFLGADLAGLDKEDHFESGIDTEVEVAEESDNGDDWAQEVRQTIERAINENHDVDIAALELNTLKMALNITFGHLRQIVLPCLLENINVTSGLTAIKQLITKWGPLLVKFVHSDEDQYDMMEILGVYFIDVELFFQAC